jgi:hypothetical protein
VKRGFATEGEREMLSAARDDLKGFEELVEIIQIRPHRPLAKTVRAMRAAYRIIDAQVTH